MLFLFSARMFLYLLPAAGSFCDSEETENTSLLYMHTLVLEADHFHCALGC